jgi:putative redox protein
MERMCQPKVPGKLTLHSYRQQPVRQPPPGAGPSPAGAEIVVQVSSIYEGGLRCRATHGPSGTTLVTDAPVDNHGKGESFSPTDLVATALGACMMTIMGIVAERHGIDLKGMTAETVKEMTKEPPRRIASLATRITMPLPPDHPHRALLEQAAHTCPVHKSLHPEIAIPVEFVWAG